VGTIRVGSCPVTVAATHLSNRQGHNVRQLRDLQGLAAAWAAPRLLVGDVNRPSPCCWWPPGGVIRSRGARVAAAPVSDHRALVVEVDIATF